MTLLETWLLAIGIFCACLVLSKLLSLGLFSITKKPKHWSESHHWSDHDWLVSREREERLKAAAIWKGYRKQ